MLTLFRPDVRLWQFSGKCSQVALTPDTELYWSKIHIIATIKFHSLHLPSIHTRRSKGIAVRSL